MPQSGVNYPSSAFTGPYQQGRAAIFDSYIFASGLSKPEHSDVLTEKFGKQYTMTTLLDRMGAYSPCYSHVYSWSILDRTRNDALITSGDGTGATVTLTLDSTNNPASGAQLGYFLVDDVLRSETGIKLKVTAVGISGGSQTITVARLDGTSIAANDFADGERIGHLYNAFDEGSSGPNGRLWFPSEDYNYFTTFRRAAKITRDAASSKSYVKVDGKDYWYWSAEKYALEELLADQERSLMFGTRTEVGAKRTAGGIWDKVVTQAQGQIVNYTTATGISESDFFTMIPRLVRQGCSKNLLLLAGSEAASDIQQALRVYSLNGGVNFGSFGNNKAGVDYTGYKFMNVNIAFEHYPMFDDAKSLPFVSTSTASKVNFRNVALILDLGDGVPNIEKIYRDGDQGQGKLIHKVVPGMVGSDGGFAANSEDAYRVDWLSELSWKVNNAHRMGAFVPNA